MKPGTPILIVEDDRSIARFIQLELEHRGFVVRCAHDGPSGLEATLGFEPSVIILDIMLPSMDGVGVLKELRRQGSRVPVIMLTARDASADKIHSLDVGADDYLTKPFDIEELMARNPRSVLFRDLLLSRVWGQEFGVQTNVVDVYVGYLREKMVYCSGDN